MATAAKEGDPGAIAVLAGQQEFARSVGFGEFSQALSRRLGIAPQWTTLMKQYPLVLLPPCAELPFADNLDLKSPQDYRRVWTAQAPMIGLPVSGLPGLTLASGLLDDGTPVGIHLVAARYREDVCLAVAEAIAARSAAVTIAEP